MLRIFSKKQKGANLVEYALLAALVGVASIASLKALTKDVSTTFSKVSSAVR